jgi:hypothetical protein
MNPWLMLYLNTVELRKSLCINENVEFTMVRIGRVISFLHQDYLISLFFFSFFISFPAIFIAVILMKRPAVEAPKFKPQNQSAY